MSSTARSGRLVVWHISDGRRGHDNQCLGLVQALQRLRTCEYCRIDRLSHPGLLLALARGRFPLSGDIRPDPDLIIGAGRGTHATMLAARRIRGGRTIVLMRPGLPVRWFDVCLIPEHDRPGKSPGIISTDGALSRITPAIGHRLDRGIILVGGPSRHHRWDPVLLQAQLQDIAVRTASIHWVVTDSPRTPVPTSRSLASLQYPNMRFVPHPDQLADWLPGQLAEAAYAWITEDSVSMIYDALTAGAAVGLLRVPVRRRHRITLIPEQLQSRNMVTLYRDWTAGRELSRPPITLNESARCAALLLGKFSL